jgi:DNA-binding NarL/FixJ family response regulator
VQVIIFSMYDETVYAERAVRLGASGYLMKKEPLDELVRGVRAVDNEEVYLSDTMTSRILNKVAGGESSDPGFPIDALTDRELAVFQMLGEGKTVEEIQDGLNIARKTVEAYRRRAKEKLGFNSVSELLQCAVQWAHAPGGDPEEMVAADE